MHAWPVHTTKLVAVPKVSSYATADLSNLEEPVVDSFKGTVYA